MASRQSQFGLRCGIRTKLVSHQHVGREAVLFEQLAHQFQGCRLVAPPLHQQIENRAFVVDRSPEPESPAGDQNCHLVQMPARGGPMTSAAKFLGEQRPELHHPPSDRFIGDVQPALGQQIFAIAEAEGKAKIQPHGVPDDVRRELVASERDLHRPSYPKKETSATAGVTKPYELAGKGSRRACSRDTVGCEWSQASARATAFAANSPFPYARRNDWSPPKGEVSGLKNV